MRIRLHQIEDEPFRWSETETVAVEALEEPDVLALSPIEWSGSVTKAPPGFRLAAHLKYRQTLACGRCLQPCEGAVESDIDLLILINPPEPTTGEIQLEASDLGILAIDSEELDTDPILLEQLELNIPMSVLCRPDCAGLCPHCGADRNEQPECCEGGGTDPRWKALEDLELS